ncbi:MYB-related transcription factor [Abeliophyllum distichum]|uniref:MYB-related transcription factor n=1 Tax=Abeliophyllum distichum TaxID=126358 RepID=A0ABD1RW50_9LAMI
MESQTNCQNDQNAPPMPTGSSYNNLMKHEIRTEGDGFCMESFSSRGYLQDFHHLDHNFLSFNPDLEIQSNGYDPFDPFLRASSSKDFDFDEFKVFEETDDDGLGIQNFQGAAGFLNFPNRKNPYLEMETASENIGFIIPKPLNFSDESSCVTAENSHHKKSNTKNKKNSNSNTNESESTLSGRGPKASKSAKAQWTVEEDRVLIHLVERFGLRKWSHIAQMLKGRIGKQCRERWHNHLRPDIKKDLWSEEEDKILIEAHAEVGNKWSEIAKKIPGRTENSIKNHWNATKRRKFSRRKSRTKWPRPSSLLQDYIQSLNLEKGDSRRNVQPPGAHTAMLSNNSFQELGENPGLIEFSPGDHLVPCYNFDQVMEFSLDDEISLDDVPFHIPPPLM